MTLLFSISLLVGLPLLALLSELLPGDATAWGELSRPLIDGELRQRWLYTVAVTSMACLVAASIAIPAALVAVRADPPIRAVIAGLGLLPLAMPAFASAALLRDLTGDGWGSALPPGVEPRVLQLILTYAWHYLPLLLFGLIVGLNRIDRSLTASARNLGASDFRVWRQITLPLATPPFLMGIAVMALKIIEDVGTPLVLGVDRMLAPRMLATLADGTGSTPELGAQLGLLLVTSVLLCALFWHALLSPRQLGPADPRRGSSRSAGRLVALIITLLIALLAITPYAWMLIRVQQTPVAWSELLPEVIQRGTLVATLAAAAVGGGVLLVSAGLLLGLSQATDWRARAARYASTALFALPGPVLALAYARLQPGSDPVPSYLCAALGLTVAFKLLPLVVHLLPARDPGPPIGLPRDYRWASRARAWLPAPTRMIIGLFLVGAAAVVFELSAALILFAQRPLTLAPAIFQALQQPPPSIAAAALPLGLIGATVIGLSVFLLARHDRVRTEPRRALSNSARPANAIEQAS